MGPIKQFKKMFAATRIIATVLVFVAVAMTLFAALHVSIMEQSYTVQLRQEL